MYAVFEVSGFQVNAEEGSIIRIPQQDAEKGAKIDFNEVLLVKKGEETIVGKPYVDGARIEAEVIDHGQDDKVLVFKFKRRTKYRKKQGHRQDYSEIKINKIVLPE